METPHPPATAEFGHVTPGGPVHEYPPEPGVIVRKRSVGPFDNNVYAIRSAGEALIVDGANDPHLILEMTGGAEVTGIVQTHSHLDHVQALQALVDELVCPVYAHPKDAARIPLDTLPLDDGDVLRVGSATARVLHTPGHTPGSLCFVVGSFLFSGDTLFPGGPGNTEGDAGRFAQIVQALTGKLFTLPDETRVCPGHGLDTTIGREREHLPVWRARGW